jgi:hypothetical protein
VAYPRIPHEMIAARGLIAGVKGRKVLESLAVGRLRTTSVVKGFADAIVVLPVVNCFEA